MIYNFEILYFPAKKHAGPDALFRKQVCRKGLMGDLDSKHIKQAILAGLRVAEETTDDLDIKVETDVACVSCIGYY